MPRKLDAGLAGRYLMSSVLMTSTMKSEPGVPLSREGIAGVPVSAAATWAFGGSADGNRCCACGAVAASAGLTAPAAPVTAAAARNLRRLSFGLESCAANFISPCYRLWPGGIDDRRSKSIANTTPADVLQ